MSSYSLREQAAMRARALQEEDQHDDEYYDGHQQHDPSYNYSSPPVSQSYIQQPQQYQQQPSYGYASAPPPESHPSMMTPQKLSHGYQPTNGSTIPQQTVPPSSATDMAKSARDEWRQHGQHGVTQALEETRRQHVGSMTTTATGQFPALSVRVGAAETRWDASGQEYTAYVIQVESAPPEQRQWIVERRYSEFSKLHQLLQQYNIQLFAEYHRKTLVSFPSKSLVGSVANGLWTPSKAWAPQRHASLVHYRTRQLDVWFVHVVALYNTSSGLPDAVAARVYDFLTQPSAQAPCARANELMSPPGDTKQSTSVTTNPFACTLGSILRQATKTVQMMTPPSAPMDPAQRTLLDPDPDATGIPLELLHASRGIAILVVAKAGLVVSGRVGTGCVVARLDNENNRSRPTWSAPCAIGTVGMGWGALMGGDVTRYVIVLTTDAAVRDLVKSLSVNLGAELGVAVGPIGRGAQSSVTTGDWTLHPAYAYAQSQGFFAGMSLEGSVVTVREKINTKFYGQPVDPVQLLQQPGPKAAEPLYQALDEALALNENHQLLE